MVFNKVQERLSRLWPPAERARIAGQSQNTTSTTNPHPRSNRPFASTFPIGVSQLAVPSNLYQSLAPREVRLLRMLPPRDSRDAREPIRCVLETASIDDMPHYSALSYEWGRPDAEAYPGSIYVNQCRMNLKVNLAAALMRLWDISLGDSSVQIQPRIPPLFWIDAICINQGDVAERSQQVRLMRDIYHNAFSVFCLAWRFYG